MNSRLVIAEVIILGATVWIFMQKCACSGRDAEKPGTLRNGTGSNCCTIQTWTPDMLQLINMPGSSIYGELISRPVPATMTGQAPSRQLRGTQKHMKRSSHLSGIFVWRR